MPHCTTKYFGTISYEESSVLEFPAGLPGFESECRFVSLEQPVHQPLVFLQSVVTPNLCFIALPAAAVEPSYELEMDDTDLEVLGVETATGKNLLKLALVTISETGMTAKLLAPIVINTANLRAVKPFSPNPRYSHLH